MKTENETLSIENATKKLENTAITEEGLNKSEIALIRYSWRKIRKIGMRDVGLGILYKLFEEAPQLRKKFDRIIPEDGIFTIERMRMFPTVSKHGLMLATALSEIIRLLEKPSELKAHLNALGKIHIRFKIAPAHFDLMGPVLLSVVEKSLGRQADEEVMGAWKKLYLDIVKPNILIVM